MPDWSNPTLTHTYYPSAGMPSVHDQIQIALAIADESSLKAILTQCAPPITQYHLIGSVVSKIGVPIPNQRAADGVIQFEAIHCVLADPNAPIEQALNLLGDRDRRQREYAKLTRCESETYTLGQNLTWAQAIALLAHAGFTTPQIETILRLPSEAHHGTWWYGLDSYGHFSLPFRRTLRTLHYTDGTLTLHYKDQYAQSQPKPPCFHSQQERVLVAIASHRQTFSRMIERINGARESLGIPRAILIGDHLSDLEVQGYMSQGISLYTAHELLLPLQAHCADCQNLDCALRGQLDSPVEKCRQFCLEGQFIET